MRDTTGSGHRNNRLTDFLGVLRLVRRPTSQDKYRFSTPPAPLAKAAGLYEMDLLCHITKAFK